MIGRASVYRQRMMILKGKMISAAGVLPRWSSRVVTQACMGWHGLASPSHSHWWCIARLVGSGSGGQERGVARRAKWPCEHLA